MIEITVTKVGVSRPIEYTCFRETFGKWRLKSEVTHIAFFFFFFIKCRDENIHNRRATINYLYTTANNYEMKMYEQYNINRDHDFLMRDNRDKDFP